jgi:hypothetical protein
MSDSTSPKTFDYNKLRADFVNRACSSSTIPHAAFRLAHLICFKYMNRESRVAFVSQETLARDLNATVRTVQYLLDALEPLGLTIERGNGRGRASSYRIGERRTSMSAIEDEKDDTGDTLYDEKDETGCTLSGQKGEISSKERVKFSAKKGEAGFAPTNKKNQERRTKKEEPRKSLTLSLPIWICGMEKNLPSRKVCLAKSRLNLNHPRQERETGTGTAQRTTASSASGRFIRERWPRKRPSAPGRPPSSAGLLQRR